MCDIELAGHIVDLDLMLAGEIDEMALGRFGKIEQRLRAFVADLLLEFFRPPSLTGAELAAIAAGRPVAEAVGLDQDHRNA